MVTPEIRERMEVVAACGTHVGVVEAVEDEVSIRLKRGGADNVHHYIATAWVAHVGQTVRLNLPHDEVVAKWLNVPFAKSGEAVREELATESP